MKRRGSLWARLPLLLLATLLVTGCATTGLRGGDDGTGELGQGGRSGTGAGDIYVQLAVEYLRQNQLEGALVNAKKAVDVDPRNAEGHNLLALVYSRIGERELAERYFRSGLEIDPRNAYIHNAYGTLLCGEGRYAEADREFNSALENPLYPARAMTLSNAGYCARESGDLSGAERYFRRALEIDPRLPPALLAMGEVSLANGSYMSARAYVERYHGVAKPTAASLWLGIRTERALGDKDQVASYSLLLRNGFPDSEETQLLRESEQR